MRRSEKILYKHSSSATESTSLSDHKSVDDDKPINLEASSTSDSILLDPSKTRKRKVSFLYRTVVHLMIDLFCAGCRRFLYSAFWKQSKEEER